MPIVPRRDWPERLRRAWSLKGIFTGGCVRFGPGSSFRHKAHAHTLGPYTGWICVRKADRVNDLNLMLHELAHLIAGCEHNDAWRATVLQLGGTLDPTFDAQGKPVLRSYQKKTRRKA